VRHKNKTLWLQRGGIHIHTSSTSTSRAQQDEEGGEKERERERGGCMTCSLGSLLLPIVNKVHVCLP